MSTTEVREPEGDVVHVVNDATNRSSWPGGWVDKCEYKNGFIRYMKERSLNRINNGSLVLFLL